MRSPTLPTKRLLLRRWTNEDRNPFAAIMADPEVMRFRPAPFRGEESNDLIEETEASFEQNGFGLWAIERQLDSRLLGFAGLEVSNVDVPYYPAIGIGWTLARDVWGCGYATEAATASLDFAFGELQLSEVVADTTSVNQQSQAVMRRLGMRHDPADDFDAPWYPVGHPRRRFVLYRIREPDWRLRRWGHN